MNFESSKFCEEERFFAIEEKKICNMWKFSSGDWNLLWFVILPLWISVNKYVLVLCSIMLKLENKTMFLGSSFRSGCDLVWLQLNPGGDFRANLWSLSRPCLSDLYLPATHGKWRRLLWQWFGPLLFLTGSFSSCLTMLWLSTTLSTCSRLWSLLFLFVMILNHFCTHGKFILNVFKRFQLFVLNWPLR